MGSLCDTAHSPKSKAVASDRTPKRFAPSDDCDSKAQQLDDLWKQKALPILPKNLKMCI